MSFNRQNYDEGAYLHNLRQSTGAADYMLNAPRNDCDGRFFTSPYVRVNTLGASVCDKNPIDVDSELMGLNRKNSRCPTQQYIPQANEFCVTKGLRDCNDLGSQDSRLTNPPCTLRSTGWNRWESLCQNPQDHAILPFTILANNSLIVKDNHRPFVSLPIDQTAALPTPIETLPECAMPLPKESSQNQRQQPYPARTEIPSTTWRTTNVMNEVNGRSSC